MDPNSIPPYEPVSDEVTVNDFLLGMGLDEENNNCIKVRPPSYVFLIFNQEVLKAYSNN